MAKRLTLVLGGARSGKSDYAQRLAGTSSRVLFVATAEALDVEMEERIRIHKTSRPQEWSTLEASRHVAKAIATWQGEVESVLIDCITMLVSNIICSIEESDNYQVIEQSVIAEIEELLSVYAAQSAHWIIVSNEVGLGIVPSYPLGRIFRDALGRVNQILADQADDVILIVAGIPFFVKGGKNLRGL